MIKKLCGPLTQR